MLDRNNDKREKEGSRQEYKSILFHVTNTLNIVVVVCTQYILNEPMNLSHISVRAT